MLVDNFILSQRVYELRFWHFLQVILEGYPQLSTGFHGLLTLVRYRFTAPRPQVSNGLSTAYEWAQTSSAGCAPMLLAAAPICPVSWEKKQSCNFGCTRVSIWIGAYLSRNLSWSIAAKAVRESSTPISPFGGRIFISRISTNAQGVPYWCAPAYNFKENYRGKGQADVPAEQPSSCS